MGFANPADGAKAGRGEVGAGQEGNNDEDGSRERLN